MQVINAPDVKQRITQIGQVPSPAGAEEFDRYIRADYERWGRVVKASGAKID
jgi:tripartite-type tricarboxylate transporter receptor subunit TctC